jgi:metacaspase-1
MLNTYLEEKPTLLHVKNRYIIEMYNGCLIEYNKCLEERKLKKMEPTNTKKAALLIGINYKNSNLELRGCKNDVMSTKNMLVNQCGFLEEDIKILLEEDDSENIADPTYVNILEGIEWLVEKSFGGYGSLWFQYSGHGEFVKDKSGDEMDGYDECILTSDYYKIIDDELFSLLVTQINLNSKLFCLMDCCHSGTILDLEINYSPYPDSMLKTITNKNKSKNNVITLSGCTDKEKTKEIEFKTNEWYGMLTKTFLDTFQKYDFVPKINILLNDINENFKAHRFNQTPQISSSKDIDVNETLDI